MKILNYVRRCKSKEGIDTFMTLHAANNSHTFCGKELSEMWFAESFAGLDIDSVTCKLCAKVLAGNISQNKI